MQADAYVVERSLAGALEAHLAAGGCPGDVAVGQGQAQGDAGSMGVDGHSGTAANGCRAVPGHTRLHLRPPLVYNAAAPSVRYTGITGDSLYGATGCRAAGRAALGRLLLAHRPLGRRHNGPAHRVEQRLQVPERGPDILAGNGPGQAPPVPQPPLVDPPRPPPGPMIGRPVAMPDLGASSSSEDGGQVHDRQAVDPADDLALGNALAVVHARLDLARHERDQAGWEWHINPMHQRLMQQAQDQVLDGDAAVDDPAVRWAVNPLHGPGVVAVVGPQPARPQGRQGMGQPPPLPPPALGAHAPVPGHGVAGGRGIPNGPNGIPAWRRLAFAALRLAAQPRPRPVFNVRAPPAASLAALCGNVHALQDLLDRYGLSCARGIRQGQSSYLGGPWDCPRCAWSPLHFACYGGQKGAVRLILDRATRHGGVDEVRDAVNCHAMVQTRAGQATCSPLALAVMKRRPDLVSLLLQSGAAITGAWRGGEAVITATAPLQGLGVLLLLAEPDVDATSGSGHSSVMMPGAAAGIALPRALAGGRPGPPRPHLLQPVAVLLEPWLAGTPLPSPSASITTDCAAVLSLLVDHILTNTAVYPPNATVPALAAVLSRLLSRSVSLLDGDLTEACLGQMARLARVHLTNPVAVADREAALRLACGGALVEVCRLVRLVTLVDFLRPSFWAGLGMGQVDQAVAVAIARARQGPMDTTSLATGPWPTWAQALRAVDLALGQREAHMEVHEWSRDEQQANGHGPRRLRIAPLRVLPPPSTSALDHRVRGAAASILVLTGMGLRLVAAASDLAPGARDAVVWRYIGPGPGRHARPGSQLTPHGRQASGAGSSGCQDVPSPVHVPLSSYSLSATGTVSHEEPSVHSAGAGQANRPRRLLLPSMLPSPSALPQACPAILRLWASERAWRARRTLLAAWLASGPDQ